MSDKPRNTMFERLGLKLGLDLRTAIDMARGPLPPTIGLALYFNNYFSGEFSSFGYLVSVVSILLNCLQSRVPFVKTVIVTLLLLLLGAGITLLAGYTTVKARQHTAAPGSPSGSYNRSAAAVTGLWLFWTIWIANTMRSYRPAFNVSIIFFSIYTEIAIVTHVQQPNMHEVVSLDLKLLQAMVIGCCLAIGICLFIFPMTSRQVFFGDVHKHLTALEVCLEAESCYVADFERSEVLRVSTAENLVTEGSITLSRKPEALAMESNERSISYPHKNQVGSIDGEERYRVVIAKSSRFARHISSHSKNRCRAERSDDFDDIVRKTRGTSGLGQVCW